jgi:hypothetical protein
MYFAALKPYPIEKIKEAAVQIIRGHVYNTMPKPAEFIQFIDPPEDLDDKARLAMDKAFDMMEQYGAYATVAFDDPIIHILIQRCYGSWIEFCNTRRGVDNEKDDHFWRKQFLDEYKMRYRVAVREGDYRTSQYLIGLLDSTNSQSGCHNKTVVVHRLGQKPTTEPYKNIQIESNQPKQIAGLLPKLSDDAVDVEF